MPHTTAAVVLGVVVALTAVGSAAPPEPKYRAARTESGQPDLRGVWNFSSEVPLQRPPVFADRATISREEFAAQRAARRRVLSMLVKLAPVEDVGIDWLDNASRADDLRSSLITYPASGRLPALADGARRAPGVNEIIELVTESNGTLPPAALSALASFQNGIHDSYEIFRPTSAASSAQPRRSCPASTATTCRSSRARTTSCCSPTPRGGSCRSAHGRTSATGCGAGRAIRGAIGTATRS